MKIKLKPQVKIESVEFFPEFDATIGLSSKNREEFGREISFSEVFVELMRRNNGSLDQETVEKILSFKEARIDFKGSLFMFN